MWKNTLIYFLLFLSLQYVLCGENKLSSAAKNVVLMNKLVNKKNNEAIADVEPSDPKADGQEESDEQEESDKAEAMRFTQNDDDDNSNLENSDDMASTPDDSADDDTPAMDFGHYNIDLERFQPSNNNFDMGDSYHSLTNPQPWSAFANVQLQNLAASVGDVFKEKTLNYISNDLFIKHDSSSANDGSIFRQSRKQSIFDNIPEEEIFAKRISNSKSLRGHSEIEKEKKKDKKIKSKDKNREKTDSNIKLKDKDRKQTNSKKKDNEIKSKNGKKKIKPLEKSHTYASKATQKKIGKSNLPKSHASITKPAPKKPNKPRPSKNTGSVKKRSYKVNRSNFGKKGRHSKVG